MKKTGLFRTKDVADKRSLTHKVRVTTAEDVEIRHLAAIRQMDLSEFYRRSALGRRADVDVETEIVLALRDFTRAVRELYAGMMDRDIVPPEELLKSAIQGASAAMLRI